MFTSEYRLLLGQKRNVTCVDIIFPGVDISVFSSTLVDISGNIITIYKGIYVYHLIKKFNKEVYCCKKISSYNRKQYSYTQTS